MRIKINKLYICKCLIIQYHNIDGLMHDCSNSIANALELLQSCTKPLILHCLHPITSCQQGPFPKVITSYQDSGAAFDSHLLPQENIAKMKIGSAYQSDNVDWTLLKMYCHGLFCSRDVIYQEICLCYTMQCKHMWHNNFTKMIL